MPPLQGLSATRFSYVAQPTLNTGLIAVMIVIVPTHIYIGRGGAHPTKLVSVK